MKKGLPKNFAKFTGKHLCQSLFFNKVAILSLATTLKKRPWHRCFPVNFVKYLKHLFSQNTSSGCFENTKNHLKFAFYFMFTFSFKFSQTSLKLIKHENKFNRKVFPYRENSENRFSEF